MPALRALDLPAGPPFVAALQDAWDAGDAVLPVDQRLPPRAKDALLDELRPAVVVGPDGSVRRRRDDLPVEVGDALVVATSGSTGGPKGVVLTHDAVAVHARAVHARLEVDPGHDRWLACLPLAHVGGLGVVTRAVVTGTPLDLMASFDAATVDAWGREHEARGLVSLVPTALERVDSTTFRWVVLGGSEDHVGRPANVVHTYGLTESGGGVVYDGRPLDGVEVSVVDDQIHLRSKTLLRVYRDGTDPRSDDGWLATGDLGSLDPRTGRLTVYGRRDELIVTGGENVWPTVVEAALVGHPSVAEVAVAGRADPDWGQRVVAWVIVAPDRPIPTLDGLRAWAKDRIPAFAAPREVRVVDALPRTALGKVRRSSLTTVGDVVVEDL